MIYLYAFLVGGALCLCGQLLINHTKLTPGRVLVGFVVAGVVISALGWYAPLVEFAGAGATVPLTGFGHLLVEGVRAGVNAQGLLGAFSGGLGASAAGLETVMIAGLLVAIFFKRKGKKI
ncbi:MAG: SpoVA/SpoVAEb family sporulation membrane protein [Oscillospiraceae bacterium]|nr:SpoVA/SpoVAEb family sporulation membrane protein [Oscillospiraceae bacterium]